MVRADPSRRADRRAGRDAGGVRGARPDRVRGAAERQADVRHRADLRLRARRRAGLRGRRDRGAGVQLLLRPGTVDPVADGRLGRHRDRRRRPRADLATAGRSVAGRWRSPAGVCGFAFTAVQDVGDWITYSDHSLRQLGVYVGQGLGFDAIYAGSCVVFALAFGPALLRSIQRFTKRLEITWLAPGSSVAPLLAVAVALVGPRPSPAAPGRRRRAAPPTSCSGRSTICCTPRTTTAASAPRPAAVELAVRRLGGARTAVGRRATAERRPRAGADRLYRARGGCQDAGSIERNILVARAAGLSATDFGGHDLVAMLRAKFTRNGSVGGAGQPDHVRDPGAARRRGRAVPARTGRLAAGPAGPRRRLRLRRRRGGASDVDDTGAALEALASLPVRAPPRSAPGRSPTCAASRTTTAVSRRNRGGLQRPVDRLGGPGARRRRREPGRGAPRRAVRRRWPICSR